MRTRLKYCEKLLCICIITIVSGNNFVDTVAQYTVAQYTFSENQVYVPGSFDNWDHTM